MPPFVVYKDSVNGFWLCTSGKLNQSGKWFKLAYFGQFLMNTSKFFEIFSQHFRKKNKIETDNKFFCLQK